MENEFNFCIRCGRKLKSELARTIGMGKVCSEKSKTSPTNISLFNIEVNKNANDFSRIPK